MAYVKIMYQNSPSTATPINAENLNHMDDQIALNDQRLTEIETSYVKSFNGRKGEVTPQANDYNMSQITPTNGATVGQIPIVRNDGTEEEPNLTFHMEDVPSSGHVIQNASGTDMAQEDAMQFADSFVSDDEVNGITIVENIKEVDPADYASTTDEGIIVTDDGNDALIGAVSDDKVEVTADGDKTYAQLLNELYADADLTKVNGSTTTLKIGVAIFNIFGLSNYECYFSASSLNSQLPATEEIRVSSSSYYNRYRQGQFSDLSSTKPSNGTKITLYYGNKKATVDLQTTANRCLMPDGTTKVSDLLDSNVAIWNGGVSNVTASNAVTMVKPDGTEVSSYYTGMIILQTSTSQGGTGSVYMVRSGYMTPVFEGTSARAPRLVIEDGVIKVKLNSDTTGRRVVYTVIKYPS